jgi:myo-inositol 2-dehydrogenase/D-chiro-inositol 1-dehydrogenase
MTKIKRRSFLQTAAAVTGVTILKPSLVFGSKANSAIRVGIIGCGGRGTSVISSMSTNANINIIAMADLFQDQLLEARGKFNKLNAAKSFGEIPRSNIYQGSSAYLQLLNNTDVDAVLISSPAYTHPGFMEAAVKAGKHVYCEKPVALDVDGCNRVEAIGRQLKDKLSVVIGFQIRHATAYVDMVQRIQRGDIGDLVTAQLYYLSSHVPIKEIKNISADEQRIRNHFQFNALSGGILLDQGIHMLDVCNWALNGVPSAAMGTGGKKGRPALGDAWNNYQVIYQYPNDVNVSFHSTQLGPDFGDVCARFIGTKGIAEAHYSGGVFIKGENAWDSGVLRGETEKLTQQQQAAGIFTSALHDANANKVKAFVKSIETGNHLNEIKSGVESTLTAILGRQAAVVKRELAWDEVRSSNERIDAKLNLSQFDPK